MHAVGVDTAEVDNEMDEMRERLSSATGLGPIAKLSASSPGIAKNPRGWRKQVHSHTRILSTTLGS